MEPKARIGPNQRIYSFTFTPTFSSHTSCKFSREKKKHIESNKYLSGPSYITYLDSQPCLLYRSSCVPAMAAAARLGGRIGGHFDCLTPAGQPFHTHSLTITVSWNFPKIFLVEFLKCKRPLFLLWKFRLSQTWKQGHDLTIYVILARKDCQDDGWRNKNNYKKQSCSLGSEVGLMFSGLLSNVPLFWKVGNGHHFAT